MWPHGRRHSKGTPIVVNDLRPTPNTQIHITNNRIQSLTDALKVRDARLREIQRQLAQPVVVKDREVLKAALDLRTGNGGGFSEVSTCPARRGGRSQTSRRKPLPKPRV